MRFLSAWLLGWLLACVGFAECCCAYQDQHSGAKQKPTPAIEELFVRARQGDLSSVRTWLQSNKAVKLADADGTTLGHWAVFHRDVALLEELTKRGERLDERNRYGVTPLSLACEYGHHECASYLIQQGAKVESARPGGERPLMLAARAGSVALVAKLIEAMAQLNATDRNGQTALMWAAAAGHEKVVDVLLDSKADPEIRTSKSGFNAFLFAAREGKLSVVRRLLAAGCDVNQTLNVKRSGGRNPRKNMSALLLAVESGHLDLALYLVEQGADPNDQRSDFAPLHAITWVRKTKLGDNPAGDPPPRIAGRVSSLEFVHQLIERGADVNLRLKRGRAPGKAQLNTKFATPFLLAAQTADLPLMKLLVESGADPTLTNEDQCNALMACAGIGAVAVGEEPGTEPEVLAAIQWLRQFEFDINHVDKNGETAVHGAAYRNYPQVVRLLGQMGAKVEIWNQKNRFGWTPIDIGHGRRPGSLKPSPPTLAALDSIRNR